MTANGNITAFIPLELRNYPSARGTMKNSINGIKPGDPKSTDPDSLVKQPYQYNEPTGGFFSVTAKPDSTLHLQFFDDRGAQLREVVKTPPLP